MARSLPTLGHTVSTTGEPAQRQLVLGGACAGDCMQQNLFCNRMVLRDDRGGGLHASRYLAVMWEIHDSVPAGPTIKLSISGTLFPVTDTPLTCRSRFLGLSCQRQKRQRSNALLIT
jgi:hypothetical protein